MYAERLANSESQPLVLLTPTVNHTPWSTVQETRRMSPPPIRHLSLLAVGLLGLSLTDNQVLRLDPGSPSLVRAHDHVIGYNPPLPTLIKSSGAKNCRVSIPVCKPYTNPLGTNCRPPTLLGPRAKSVIPRGKVGTTSTRSENGPRRSFVSHGRRDSISATTAPRSPPPTLLPCHSNSPKSPA